MTLTQFYGVLATTASIFVGILTAYLVTRLSDFKTERSRIKQRVDSIDAELGVLDTRRSFRANRLEDTEERWRLENAEDEVDNFIEYDVGRGWNPSPDSISINDTLDALIEHRELTESDLIQHHREMIENRWGEIVDELQPRSLGIVGEVPLDNETYTAANWIQDTLWDIYEREKYDYHGSQATEIAGDIQELENEREILVQEHNSLDPQQLQDSIKTAIVPIVLSVILPVFVRFLHEVGWEVSIPSQLVVIEPILVLIAWLVGFFWTLRFVWIRVTDAGEELTEEPPSQQGPDESSEELASDETDRVVEEY